MSRIRDHTIDDRGSAVVELPLIVVAFILLLWLGYGGIRLVTVQGDVQAAAWAGARAASGSYSAAAGISEASAVVDDMLASDESQRCRVGWCDHHRFLVAGRPGFGHGHLRGLVVRGDRGRVPRFPDLPVDGG